MKFIETSTFTREVLALMRDEDYHALQLALYFRPEHGSIIKGSGGLRKLRWYLPGEGKRGGIRVIYFWDKPNQVIYLLFVYRKNQQDDLTPDQVKVLKKLVQEALK